MMNPCFRKSLASGVFALAVVRAAAADITVHLDRPGAAIRPTLYGAFFEDINRAGDGGLYAELVQNRSFEDNASLIAWTPLTNANAVATFELDKSAPLNPNNPTSLKIRIESAGGGRVGVFNQGFKGIVARGKEPETSESWRQRFEAAQRSPVNGLAVSAGREYHFSIYGREQDFSGAVTVQGGELRSFKRVDVEEARRVIRPGRSSRVVREPRGRVRTLPGRPPGENSWARCAVWAF